MRVLAEGEELDRTVSPSTHQVDRVLSSRISIASKRVMRCSRGSFPMPSGSTWKWSRAENAT